MADDDLRVAKQWGKLRRVALIAEDRAFQRRLDLGENPRRDAGGEIAEKQGFHTVLSSPTHDENEVVGTLAASHAEEFPSLSLPGAARTRRGVRQTGGAISTSWQTAPRIPTGVNPKRAATRYSMNW